MLALLLLVPSVVVTNPVESQPDTETIPAAIESNGVFPQLRILVLESTRRSRFATPSLDVAASVAVQLEQTIATIDRYTIENRLENAETEVEREAILQSAVDQAQKQAFEIRKRDNKLRNEFRDGTIDSSTFLRELAELNAEAASLDALLDFLLSQAEGDSWIDL